MAKLTLSQKIHGRRLDDEDSLWTTSGCTSQTTKQWQRGEAVMGWKDEEEDAILLAVATMSLSFHYSDEEWMMMMIPKRLVGDKIRPWTRSFRKGQISKSNFSMVGVFN